ncbi:MAG: S41 family peptidase [Gammaproteobacteria bacterium]|nr:MAG: S41 family peptidase [Gammaproteobacteria bacterium]
MSLKVRGLLAVSIGTVLGFSLSLGSAVLAERQDSERGNLPWKEARLLAEVLERVKRDYVDEVDDERLMEAAIRGMVANLDPHSSYLNAEEYDEIRISTSGNYSGVGLELGIAKGRIVVVAPMDGSPAEDAGFVSGDVLLSIDGVPVDSSDLNDAVTRLRGNPGTRVRVAILHGDSEDPQSVELVRSQILVSTVHSEYIEPAIGYVRLTHFSETSGADLRREVTKLSALAGGHLEGMVLDLRGNPGGVLDAAIEVSDAFLNDGLIVSADGRVPDASFKLVAEKGDILDGAPMIVLVNGGSASASEIVAGALQDNHRATVVGTATFGKGSVQTVMPLSHGRAIKLTTSRYYTPSGRSIHRRGIAPDVVAEPAVVAGAGTDPQLTRALDFLKTQRVASSNTE